MYHSNIFGINRILNQTLKLQNNNKFLGIGKNSLFFISPLLNPISHISAESFFPAQQSTSPSLCILKHLWVLKDAIQSYNAVQINGSHDFPCLHSYTPSLLQKLSIKLCHKNKNQTQMVV